jgi:hypothetical protein
MDDLRNSLEAAENQTRLEIDRLNNVLKHILLARHSLDLEEGEQLVLMEGEEPTEPHDYTKTMRDALIPEQSDKRAKAERKWGAEPTEPSGLMVTFKTRYEKGTLSSCIVNVLNRAGEPVNSKNIHEELTQGGWKSNSKDSLMAVRNALVRMKGDIKSEKIEGIFHYSLLPIKELV